MFIPAQVEEAIHVHADNCLPNECCGLLAMDDENRIRMAYALTNIEGSPARFTMAPEEQFGAFTHAERLGWRIGGVFHSHPIGEATLSPRDIFQPHDPDWIHVVVGMRPERHLRVWRIENDEPREITL